ncbi:MAG: MoxR family ATPase [Lawsonibacter sp.]
MIIEQSEHIICEVGKAFMGKDDIVRKVLMTIYAGGHILLEDCPGVGKTTLALAFSKVLGLRFKRIQFTTDTLPSDITGFTVFNQQTGEFEYREGAANCQLLLADEINRTSPKTQSALLEVMEERSVTVDGQTHQLDAPFLCIATQNPAGAAGTQPLPDSQLDRFMVRLPIGYPSREDQIHIVQAQRLQNPLDDLSPVTDATSLIEVQQYLGTVHASDSVLGYAVDLCQATRELPLVELGVSPRGVGALVRMSRAHALLEQRDYVVPEDVQAVFSDVCAHRLVLRPQARVEGVTSQDLLTEVLRQVPPPAAPRWPHA